MQDDSCVFGKVVDDNEITIFTYQDYIVVTSDKLE